MVFMMFGSVFSSLLLSSILSMYCCAEMSKLIVEVQPGKLEGSKKNSIYSGKEYYSFLGIPYAKPPVGDQRFRPPIPAEKWEGIRDATVEGSKCIQAGDQGTEDCLYLNVYTPEPPSSVKTPKPVIVFIHGGAFMTGSASANKFGPDYLMDYDVILVTPNYRLGVFGFLNLNVPECSGNCGLKDQGLALKWVKENIQAFGGNPENITIAGESAGSASVHYHTLSPASKGLFKRAIMQSGSSTCQWAFDPNPARFSSRFAKTLGLQTDDPQKVVESLKNVTAEALLKHATEVSKQIKQERPNRLAVTYVPSVEQVGQNKFVTDTPSKMIQSKEPVPLMIGMNSKEGILKLASVNEAALTKLNNNFTALVRDNFNFNESLVADVAQKMREFYFKAKNIGMDTLDEYVDLYTSICFFAYYAPRDLIQKTNGAEPIYEYLFNFDGKFNSNKITIATAKNITGAAHSDSLGYLLYDRQLFPNPQFTDPETKVIRNLCRIWTNFAKTGNPNPVDDKGTVQWKPSTDKDPNYLRVSDTLEAKQGIIFSEQIAFWEKMLENMRS